MAKLDPNKYAAATAQTMRQAGASHDQARDAGRQARRDAKDYNAAVKAAGKKH